MRGDTPRIPPRHSLPPAPQGARRVLPLRAPRNAGGVPPRMPAARGDCEGVPPREDEPGVHAGGAPSEERAPGGNAGGVPPRVRVPGRDTAGPRREQAPRGIPARERGPGGNAGGVPPRGEWAGFFISFEGVDAAGKSTQVAALAAALRSDGHEVLTVREPGETVVGELIRSLLLRPAPAPLDPWAEALLFVSARAQLLAETVLPALMRGSVVIADRYVDSTLAYQGGGRGLDPRSLRTLHRAACGDVWPDLTILLDLPPSAAESRRRAGQLPLDRMELSPEAFHAAVHRTFRELAEAEPERIVVVDAERPAVVVSQRIWAVAAERLAEVGSPAPTGRPSA
ncbi:MAG: tmk [Chloroflexi bacterium]|jgi:dTMP kinase|nr:tmk [Chloroflexota bacterium]